MGKGRWPWGALGVAVLLAVVLTTQVFGASITVTTQPLQNPGTNSAITHTQDWSATSGSTSPSFTSTIDTYVDKGSASSNFAAATSMDVRSKKNNDRRSLVQFNVSSIPGSATITSATLTLCATSVASSTRTYDAYRVTSTWVETSVTWNTQPTVAASATDSTTTPGSPGCMTWTVTADVQTWVDGSATNYGLRVNDSAENSGPSLVSIFRTSEDTAVPADIPTLDVTYTAGSLTIRQESSDLTLNGSNQVTSVTVGGSKDAHSGTKNITVTLKDGAGATLDSGTATLPTASGTYNVSVTMSGGTTAYYKVATIDVVYANA